MGRIWEKTKVWQLTYSVSSTIWWNSDAWFTSMSCFTGPPPPPFPSNNWHSQRPPVHTTTIIDTIKKFIFKQQQQYLQTWWKMLFDFSATFTQSLFLFFWGRFEAVSGCGCCGLSSSSPSVFSIFFDLDFCQTWKIKTAANASFISTLSTLKKMKHWTPTTKNGTKSRSWTTILMKKNKLWRANIFTTII